MKKLKESKRVRMNQVDPSGTSLKLDKLAFRAADIPESYRLAINPQKVNHLLRLIDAQSILLKDTFQKDFPLPCIENETRDIVYLPFHQLLNSIADENQVALEYPVLTEAELTKYFNQLTLDLYRTALSENNGDNSVNAELHMLIGEILVTIMIAFVTLIIWKDQETSTDYASCWGPTLLSAPFFGQFLTTFYLIVLRYDSSYVEYFTQLEYKEKVLHMFFPMQTIRRLLLPLLLNNLGEPKITPTFDDDDNDSQY